MQLLPPDHVQTVLEALDKITRLLDKPDAELSVHIAGERLSLARRAISDSLDPRTRTIPEPIPQPFVSLLDSPPVLHTLLNTLTDLAQECDQQHYDNTAPIASMHIRTFIRFLVSHF
jgi:hypothetical protein